MVGPPYGPQSGAKCNGWKNASKQPVKNKDLWEKLDILAAERNVDWRWVKGHAGHAENERVDDLARKAAQTFV